MAGKMIIDKVMRYWMLTTYDGRKQLAYGSSDPKLPWRLETLATCLPEMVTSTTSRRSLCGVRDVWNKAVKERMGNDRGLKVRAVKVEITLKGRS